MNNSRFFRLIVGGDKYLLNKDNIVKVAQHGTTWTVWIEMAEYKNSFAIRCKDYDTTSTVFEELSQALIEDDLYIVDDSKLEQR